MLEELQKLGDRSRVKGHMRRIDYKSVLVRPYERETKEKEYAPGISEKKRILPIPVVEKPTQWDFTVHYHEALKRGQHLDLRLCDKNGNAHSWTLSKFPTPGNHIDVKQVETHSKPYMTFEGTIPAGYGAGKVLIQNTGKADIIEAGPKKVSWAYHEGKRTNSYTMVNFGNGVWRMFNTSTTKETYPIKREKGQYRESRFEDIDIHKPGEILQPKVDGASTKVYLEAGKHPRLFSVRESKKDDPLEYSYKVMPIFEQKVPSSIAGRGKDKSTIAQAETYAMDGGRALSTETIAGILNSGVERSRELQRQLGSLKAMLFNIEQWKGKDVSKVPYREKLDMIRDISKHIKGLDEPPVAATLKEKEKLIKDIREKKHKLTDEGVVKWDIDKPGQPPTRGKIIWNEQDVYIRDIFPGKGRLEGKGAGGFSFSTTPKGRATGRMGGLPDAMRFDAYRHPEKYKGLVARIQAQKTFSSGKFRAPRFIGFHLDKNIGKFIPDPGRKGFAKESGLKEELLKTRDIDRSLRYVLSGLIASSPIPGSSLVAIKILPPDVQLKALQLMRSAKSRVGEAVIPYMKKTPPEIF